MEKPKLNSHFTWDSRNDSGDFVPEGEYAWKLEGRDVVGHGLSLAGDMEVVVPINLEVLSVQPETFNPRDPGGDAAASLTYSLERDANVEAAVYGEGCADPVYVFPTEEMAAGEHTLSWDGSSLSSEQNAPGPAEEWRVTDGIYTIRIRATIASGAWEEKQAEAEVVSRPLTIDGFEVAPAVFAPGAEGDLGTCVASFELSEDAFLTLSISDSSGTEIINLASSQPCSAGLVDFTWDGADTSGSFVEDGTYTLGVTAWTNRGKAASASATVEVDIPPAPQPQVILPAAEPNHPSEPATFEVVLPEGASEAVLELNGATLTLTRGESGRWACEIPNQAGMAEAILHTKNICGASAETPVHLELSSQTGDNHLLITDEDDFRAGDTGQDLYSVPGWISNWRPLEGDTAWRLDTPPDLFTYYAYRMVNFKGEVYAFGSDNKVRLMDMLDYTSEVVATAPMNLNSSSIAVSQDLIYICGGGQDSWRTGNYLYTFDPVQGTFTELAPMPEKRVGGSLVEVSGKLYLLGGMIPSGNYDRDIHVYDPSCDSWVQEGAIPLGMGVNYSSNRSFGAGDRILLFSDPLSTSAYAMPVLQYVPGQEWSVLATVPLPRYATFCQTESGDILIAGGFKILEDENGDSYAKIYSSAYLFSPEDLSVHALPDLNVPRYGSAAVCFQGKAYICNGYTERSVSLDSTEILNLPCTVDEIAAAFWQSPVYDLGVAYNLARLGFSAAGNPTVTLRFSEDGQIWQETAPMSTGIEFTARPMARYVSFKVDMPAGAASSVGDIALTYEVPATPEPDLSVSSIVFDPSSPETGQPVMVYVGVRNDGAPCLATGVRLYADGQQVGGNCQFGDGIVAAGAEQSFSFVYTAISTGPVTFTATVDPEAIVVETDEANNTLASILEVLPSGISAEAAADKASYLPVEDVAVTALIRNDSARDRYLAASIFIEDTNGNQVAQIGSEDLGTLAVGEERAVSSSWNTGTTYAGDYQVRVSVTEDSMEKASDTAPFAIEPQGSLSVDATCDRISYSVGDTAGLRARLISEAVNFTYTGLVLRAEVLSPEGGIVYSSEQGCPDLWPGDLADIPFAFGVADSPAGTYTFRATVLDGEEEIASAEASFEIKSTSVDGSRDYRHGLGHASHPRTK